MINKLFRRFKEAWGIFVFSYPSQWLPLLWFFVIYAFSKNAGNNGNRHMVSIGDYKVYLRPGGMSGLHFFSEVIVEGCYDFLTNDNEASFVILDAGANVGFFSLWAAKRWPKARVVAVEPHPGTFMDLKANVDANNLSDRITLIRAALSSSQGVGNLQLHDEHNMAILQECGVIGDVHLSSATKVTLDTMDGLAQKLNVVFEVAKIDVEGAEMDVLNGAGPAILKLKSVAIEAHSPDLDSNCRLFLNSSGFEVDALRGLLHGRRRAQ
jgi:FkbM family methyltransferase